MHYRKYPVAAMNSKRKLLYQDSYTTTPQKKHKEEEEEEEERERERALEYIFFLTMSYFATVHTILYLLHQHFRLMEQGVT